jgi:hypothetical protein
VAGHDLSGAQLNPQGTYRKEIGTYKTDSGTYLRPEGVYGSTGKLGVEGVRIEQGTFGTFQKPEATTNEPKGLTATPEGRFVKPFGQAPQAMTDNSLPMRQPVAGHEASLLFVKGPSGQTWQLSNPELIKLVQGKLKGAGCDPGTVDGVANKQFSAALIKFQERNGLTANGVVDQATARALGIDWSEVSGAIRESMHAKARGESLSQ